MYHDMMKPATASEQGPAETKVDFALQRTRSVPQLGRNPDGESILGWLRLGWLKIITLNYTTIA